MKRANFVYELNIGHQNYSKVTFLEIKQTKTKTKNFNQKLHLKNFIYKIDTGFWPLENWRRRRTSACDKPIVGGSNLKVKWRKDRQKRNRFMEKINPLPGCHNFLTKFY